MAEKIGRIQLRNVRLSFPHIFTPQAGSPREDGSPGSPRYNASFLIDVSTKEGQANEKKILEAIEAVKKEKWGNNQPKLKSEKLCFRDGDLEDYDGYAGHWYLSAAKPGEKKAPVAIDRGRRPVTEADGLLYAGCYVNAIVTIWAQDSKEYGKRINAALEGVQFFAHGDAFGDAGISEDEFDEFEDEDDEMFA